ncbi:MAG: hypothetical protein KBC33_01290 [Candidatus Pacebacteria bacterium]|nr:hypothetical protein [Candidatus Paceibacterota bacterium]
MFFSHPKSSLILILDVQSSIVRGTLVHMHATSKPHVVFTHSVGIAYKPHARSGYLVKAALAAVEENVAESLRFISQVHSIKNPTHNLPKHISAVHYVLSSPWVVSQAKTISQSFKKETSVTKADILKLVSEERAKMSQKDEHDIRVIEEKIFDVRLNGYSIASWESRATTQLEVSFVSSLAGGRMIERFIQACDRAVGKKSVMFHSSLFLQHVAIQKVVPDRASYALIHVHGELTDIAIMHAHSCIFFGSYPFGIHSIVRTIARELKVSEQTADSTLNLVTQKALDTAQSKKQASIVDNMSNGWIGEFRKLLKINPLACGIPHHVIISARSHEDFFMNSFKKAYPQSTLEVLDLDMMRAHVDFENTAEKLRLTGLYIIAIHSMEK